MRMNEMPVHNLKVITAFPAPEAAAYTEGDWYQSYGHGNAILNCRARAVYYPKHWTMLSLKCAFNGRETYDLGSMKYSVRDDAFLILNDGTCYSSYIHSETPVN